MIPKPIYEALPLLYVLCGLAAVVLVDAWTSIAGGLILIISGTLILLMRRNYRSAQQQLQTN
jgi:hypothetical protein